MKAIVWDDGGLSVVDDLEHRAPAAGEVVVAVHAAGLCHSDLNPMTGAFAQATPAVLGHEASGRVIDAGPGGEALVGQRVVLTPLQPCGRCPACRAGRTSSCTSEPPADRGAFSRAGAPVHQFVRLGAWAERTVVSTSQVIPIPEELPAASAALLGCAVVTGVGAVRARAQVRPGETVVVTGAGGIGLCAVQGARLAGAGRVIVVDRNPAKRAISEQLGATDVVTTASLEDLDEALGDLAPGGIDALIECTGVPGVLEIGVARLARGGRAVIVGLPGPEARIAVSPRALYQDKAILGCRMGSVDPHTAIPELAADAVAGRLLLDPLVTKVTEPDGIHGLLSDLEGGRLDRGVMRFGTDGP